MRISGDAEDEVGHLNYQRIIASGCVPWVFINQRRVFNAVIADEERGYVLQSERDYDGKLITDENGRYRDVEYFGEVKIVVMEKEFLEHGVH